MSAEQLSLQPQKSRKVMSVELWRFIFTVMVSVYHLEIFFFSQSKIFPSGTSAVEFFFMLAGFTMAMSAKRRMENRTEAMTPKQAHALAIDYVKKKLKAIYPLLIIALVLTFVICPLYLKSQNSMWLFGSSPNILQSIINSEWELLFLVGTPFGFNEGFAPLIPFWFLTALLVVGYIYTYALHRHYDFMRFAAPVIGVLGYILFALNSNILMDHAVQMGFTNAGMLHGFADMALGISMFQLYEYLSEKELKLGWKVVLSLLEIYAIYRLFALTLWQDVGYDNFRKLIYLMIIVLFSFLNVTLVSKAFNRKIFKWVGHISLAMYLCHYPLITTYLQMLSTAKLKLQIIGSPLSKRILSLLRNTGGDRGAPMSVKDMIYYTLFVIIVAVLAMVIVWAVKKLIARFTKKQNRPTANPEAISSFVEEYAVKDIENDSETE